MSNWREDIFNQYTECPECGEMSYNNYKGVCRNEECEYEDQYDAEIEEDEYDEEEEGGDWIYFTN